MPIHSKTNLYPGINAHLNSYLQAEFGGWRSFHADHIFVLSRVIEESLPPGYYIRIETSLQIDTLDDGDPYHRSITIPDISVLHQTAFVTPSSLPSVQVASPTFTIPVLETLAEEDTLSGVVVYEAGTSTARPILRVELLSPANKPRGSHHEQYLVKRASTLRGELSLIEIDYLHETPPLLIHQPRYPRAIGSQPYSIILTDPRPALEESNSEVYLWSVTDPLPNILVKLIGKDEFTLRFGEAYNRTFESSRFYTTIVDYAIDPVNFDRYREDDQAKIRALLETIRRERGGQSA
jgi:hypothetical protein